MFIDRLQVDNFRCFEKVDIEPSRQINIILGDNASGKTSLLEAVFFLGRGETFRQASPRHAIKQGTTSFTVRGSTSAPNTRAQSLAVQRDRSSIAYRCNGERATRLDLVNQCPLQLVDPNVHRLLEQGPRFRRHFLDWGVFHVEHAFFPAWRRYRRALQQRNRALKARWPKRDTIVWDAELVRSGEMVDACRRRYIEYLAAMLPASVQRIMGTSSVTLDYHAGWSGDEGFGTALATHLSSDQKSGFTQQGPHRADFRVMAGENKARDWVSRGQQKLLTSVLLIAQASILIHRRGITPLLLIDDLAAELGAAYRETLAAEIVAVGAQCFLTFLDPQWVPESLAADGRMFHVEHGQIRLA